MTSTTSKPLGVKELSTRALSVRQGHNPGGDTVMWWLSQSEAARESLRIPVPGDISGCLKMFSSWVWDLVSGREQDKMIMWSHATFDAPILQDAFKRMGVGIPWRYSDARDLRTIQDMAYGYGRSGHNVPVPSVEPKHSALADAVRQAMMVQACYARISEGRVVTDELRLGDFNQDWIDERTADAR